MSAFICDQDNFAQIYQGLEVYKQISPNTSKAIKSLAFGFGNSKEIIVNLYALNVRSVNQRYGQNKSEAISPTELANIYQNKEIPSAGQFLKSMECLHYQMSEGTVVHEVLYLKIAEVIKAMREDKIHDSKDYKNAIWG